MRRSILFLVLAAAPSLALAGGPRLFSVKAGSTAAYKVIHKLHAMEGVSKAVEGKARWLPDGGVQVMARAPVESFDSGNSNRDAHMKEATEAARFPLVEFKGIARGVTAQAAFPATMTVPLKGLLTFHGVQQAVDVEIRATFSDADHMTAAGSFPISLESFKIERPSLMFVPVDDKATIELKLLLELDKP